jgi:hypothetical protein
VISALVVPLATSMDDCEEPRFYRDDEAIPEIESRSLS